MRRLMALVVLAIPFVAFADPADDARAAKWEKEIASLEKKQAAAKTEKGGVVFAGSSTVRMWDVSKAFPDLKPINSGFGGSEIRDSTRFADRIILNHEPRAIVFYAGDNDINSGRTPEQVVTDFKEFAETIHKKLPKTKIYFISIKPTVLRSKQFEKQQAANKLVKEYCNKDEWLAYIDVVKSLQTDDGKARGDLLGLDGLHLNAKGYEVLNEAVRKAVK
jgi:lysophospholipase L1-like esterase